jgi:hypothetical protein
MNLLGSLSDDPRSCLVNILGPAPFFKAIHCGGVPVFVLRVFPALITDFNSLVGRLIRSTLLGQFWSRVFLFRHEPMITQLTGQTPYAQDSNCTTTEIYMKMHWGGRNSNAFSKSSLSTLQASWSATI